MARTGVTDQGLRVLSESTSKNSLVQLKIDFCKEYLENRYSLVEILEKIIDVARTLATHQ